MDDSGSAYVLVPNTTFQFLSADFLSHVLGDIGHSKGIRILINVSHVVDAGQHHKHTS